MNVASCSYALAGAAGRARTALRTTCRPCTMTPHLVRLRHHSTDAADGADKSSGRDAQDDVEQRRMALERNLIGDAYFNILSTPLRQCLVTQATLPKAIMFQLAPHVPLVAARNASADGAAAQIEISERQLRTRVTDQRRGRWFRRRAKESAQRLLHKRVRLLKHKVNTAQGEDSVERFRMEMEAMSRRLQSVMRPAHTGRQPLMLVNLLRRRSRGHATHLVEGQPYVRRGKAVYCMLRYDIASILRGKASKLSGLPSDLMASIDEQLETRVVQEAKQLARSITIQCSQQQKQERRMTTPPMPWLVRRMRGKEVNTFAKEAGRTVALRDEEPVRVAAVLLANETDLLPRGDERADEPASAPIYNLPYLITDEAKRQDILAHLRSVAMTISRSAMNVKRLHTQAQVLAAREAGIELAKAGESNEATTKKDERQRVSQVKEDTAASETIQRETTAKLHVVRQDPRTVDLCLALWRLHTWRSTQPAKDLSMVQRRSTEEADEGADAKSKPGEGRDATSA